MSHPSVKAAMESTDRCILLFDPTTMLWGATTIEGSDCAAVCKSQYPSHALMDSWMVAGMVFMAPDEKAMFSCIESHGEVWAAEWWPREGHASWLRPLADPHANPRPA